MQRLSFALLLVIALVAGFTVGTVVVRPVTPATPPSIAGGRETALAFYDALNQALAGGSTDALAALLSPSFVDHDAAIGASQSAAEFLDHIRVLGRTPDVARLTVEAIEESGSSLIVHLGWAETGPRVLAGISIEQAGEQPAFEVLRVARGRIIDRWTPGIRWFQATEFADIALRASGLTDIATTLVRVAVPAGVEHGWYAAGPGFLSIESDSAMVHVTHGYEDEETLELNRGSEIEVALGDRVQLRSVDEEPVTALIYSIIRPAAAELFLPASALNAQSQGVTQSLLWSGPSAPENGSTVHRLARIVLPAGEKIRIAGATDATLVLAIDSGALELRAPGGAISVLGEDLRPVDHGNVVNIDADSTASLTGSGSISLRNVSVQPVAIVLIAIRSETPTGPLIH